jgi:alpha-D-ribose 1-methylphosphonate 5-triphosphate synthase subunit PhnL
MLTPPLLAINGLAKRFTLHQQEGIEITALAGIDLELRSGECVVLAGPSGAGKSSLLRCIYGNYRADEGEILLRDGGQSIDLATASDRVILALRRSSIGYVSQFLRVVPRVPALDVVAEVLVARGAAQEEARRVATELLLRLNIPRRLHSLPPATFSGGEQQRVNLARGFIGNHPVLLVDEPTASLDTQNRAVVVAMINEAKARDIAIVAICHDAEVRDAIADRLFELTPLQDAA